VNAEYVVNKEGKAFEYPDDEAYKGTLLHWATILNKPAAIKFLLENGVDPLIKLQGKGEPGGMTAEELAIKLNHHPELFKPAKQED